MKLRTETQISHNLVKALEKNKRSDQHFSYTRLESNMTAQGIPDAILCIGGREIWLEFKVQPNTPSPLQIGFALARLKAGNPNCFVITELTRLDKGRLSLRMAWAYNDTTLGHIFDYDELTKFLLNIGEK